MTEIESGVKDMLSTVSELTDSIDQLVERRKEIRTKIALKTCPYKVGQIVVTKDGLGRHGLSIHAVVPALKPSINNLWGIETFALSKAGEVTRRGVFLDQESNDITGVKK